MAHHLRIILHRRLDQSPTLRRTHTRIFRITLHILIDQLVNLVADARLLRDGTHGDIHVLQKHEVHQIAHALPRRHLSIVPREFRQLVGDPLLLGTEITVLKIENRLSIFGNPREPVVPVARGIHVVLHQICNELLCLVGVLQVHTFNRRRQTREVHDAFGDRCLLIGIELFEPREKIAQRFHRHTDVHTRLPQRHHAVLGGDYTFAQYDATLGAALTVGTGSGGSKGTATSIDNDVDFVGFSVYGNKRCPIVNSKFDLGYMQTKSDISAANSMGNWSSDVKAKAFTFGFGVELPTTVGIVNVTPHAGIRYTRLDVEGRDGLFGTDDDKLNVFQAPLGVTFSGAFETSGWNLAPTFDLSVVPAFGDKDATTKYNGLTTEVITRVVDSSPVQATLGLSAQKDAFTFGINYTLGAGSDERQNHSFNANVRYTF